MQDAGQKLKRVRERLNLRVRDVELASQKIADRHHNDEFIVMINRVSEIENRNLVPTLYKLYSLCAIYRLSFEDVLDWYGISLAGLPADSAFSEIPNTHPVSFQSDVHGEALLPLSIDPGMDFNRTTYFSRMIQRWGKAPAPFSRRAGSEEPSLRLHRNRGQVYVPAAAARIVCGN